MAVSREIKTIFAIDGEKKYSDAIEDINKKQKILSAEMKASGAAFDANGDKQGKLRMQVDNLSKQLDLQKKKVAEAKAAMEQATKKYGENSDTTQELKLQYYNAETALSKLQGTIVKTNQDLALQESKLKQAGDAAQRAGEKMKSAGAGMNQVGSTMTSGITVPVMAAAAGLAALVIKTTDTAGDLQEMSDKTGLTAERLQELKYAGADLGVELEEITGTQSKLTKAMAAGKDESSAQGKAFKKLKVDAVDPLTGQLRDSNVVFGEVIDALGDMTNPTERDAVALTLLGKSAIELNPLIKAGSTEINRLTEEAHKNGAVMSNESVKGMDSFGDSIEKAKLSIGTAAGELTVELMPTLEKLLPIVQKDIVPAIKDGAETFGEWAEAFSDLNPAAQKTVLTLAGLLVVAGPLLKVGGNAMTVTGGLTTGIGKLASAYAAHAAKAAAAAAGTEGLAVAEVTATGAGAGLAATLAPILIVVAALGATAIALDVMTEASQASKSASEELKNSCNDTAEAFAKQGDEAEANATIAGNLSEQLYALNDKEQKSNVDKLKMVELVKQLNSVMPELNLSINEQTGALSKTKKATDDLIAAKLKELKMEAGRERLLELYKENITITKDLATAQENWNKASDDYNPLDLRNSLDIMNYEDSVTNLTEAQTKNNKSTKELEDAYMEAAEGISDANNDVVESGENTTQLTQEQLDEQQAARDEWAQNMETAASEYQSEMGSIEQKGIEQSKLTAKEWQANLEQQAEDLQAWRENMLILAQELPAEFVEYLRKLGPGEAQIIQDLADGSQEERQAAVDAWRAWAAAAEQAAIDELGKAPAAAEIQGNATGFAFVNALNAAAATVPITAPMFPVTTFSPSPAPTTTIPKYAVGTKYVPEDQIAMIHEGEAIIPKAQNPYINSNLVSSPEATFDGTGFDQMALNNAAASSMDNTARLASAASKIASGASQLQTSGQIVHSGQIDVVGVNNQGETVGATTIIMDQLRREFMLSGN